MITELSDERVLFFKNTRFLRLILVITFLLIGFGIRLVDLSDPPLDFAATRQLHSLVLARGYYYALDVPSTRALTTAQREFGIADAANEALDEPPILEHIIAYIYASMGQENFEIPRVVVSFFWVIGGFPLYKLMKKITTTNGGLFALAFYELLPFGVIAGRSFQPDPVMVTFILFALYYQYCWALDNTILNALLAGGFTCLAVIAKVPAAFFAGIPFIGFVLKDGFKKAFHNKQVYWMALLSLLPAAIYYFVNATLGNNSTELFGTRFFPSLYIQPKWYQSWFMMAKSVVGYIPLFFSIIAFFLSNRKEFKILYGCMWLGYLLQGIVLAYHVSSHNYYHLPLIPIVAIGCGVAFAIVMDKIQSMNPNWLSRITIIFVLLFAGMVCASKSRDILLSADYRYEETYWRKLGQKIGVDTPIIALTHDYGLRLSYWGGILPRLWMTQGDFTVESLLNAPDKPFEIRFKEATEGCDYFLITLENDFNSQKDLHDYLFAHFHYTQGEGYYLFDLKNPLFSKGL